MLRFYAFLCFLGALAGEELPLPFLRRHPKSDPWPHKPGTIRVESLNGITGVYSYEDLRRAMGLFIWRNWVNNELGGLCIGGDGDSNGKCIGGTRTNVSAVSWDVSGSSTDIQQAEMREFYREACSRNASTRPHWFHSPYSSGYSIDTANAIYNLTKNLSRGCLVPFFAGAASPALYNNGYGWVFSALPSTVQSVDPLLDLFSRHNIKSWGSVHMQGDPFSEYLAMALDHGVSSHLKGNQGKMVGKKCAGYETSPTHDHQCSTDADCPPGIKCKTAAYIPEVLSLVNALQIIKWTQYFADLNPEAFVIMGHITDAVSFMEALKVTKWTPLVAATGMTLSLTPDVMTSDASINWYAPNLFVNTMQFGIADIYLGNSSQVAARMDDPQNAAEFLDPSIFSAGSASLAQDYLYPAMVLIDCISGMKALERAGTRGWTLDNAFTVAAFDLWSYELHHLGRCAPAAQPASVSDLQYTSCQNTTECAAGEACWPFNTFWGPNIYGDNGETCTKTLAAVQVQKCSPQHAASDTCKVLAVVGPASDPRCNVGNASCKASNNYATCSCYHQFPSVWTWDECPDDHNKIEPGVCGCGMVEDANADGIPDCLAFQHLVKSWEVGGSVLGVGLFLVPWVIWGLKRYGLLAIGFVGTVGGEFALLFLKVFIGFADAAATQVSFWWILLNRNDSLTVTLYAIFTSVGLAIQIVNTALRARLMCQIWQQHHNHQGALERSLNGIVDIGALYEIRNEKMNNYILELARLTRALQTDAISILLLILEDIPIVVLNMVVLGSIGMNPYISACTVVSVFMCGIKVAALPNLRLSYHKILTLKAKLARMQSRSALFSIQAGQIQAPISLSCEAQSPRSPQALGIPKFCRCSPVDKDRTSTTRAAQMRTISAGREHTQEAEIEPLYLPQVMDTPRAFEKSFSHAPE